MVRSVGVAGVGRGGGRLRGDGEEGHEGGVVEEGDPVGVGAGAEGGGEPRRRGDGEGGVGWAMRCMRGEEGRDKNGLRKNGRSGGGHGHGGEKRMG